MDLIGAIKQISNTPYIYIYIEIYLDMLVELWSGAEGAPTH